MSQSASVARVRQVIALLEEVRQEALALYPRIDAGEEMDGDLQEAYFDLYDALEDRHGDNADPQSWGTRDAVWEALQAVDQQEAGE